MFNYFNNEIIDWIMIESLEKWPVLHIGTCKSTKAKSDHISKYV